MSQKRIVSRALRALRLVLSLLVLCGVIVSGCTSSKAGDDEDTGGSAVVDANTGADTQTTGDDAGIGPLDLFQPDELLEIEIAMSEGDWETLRWEGRALPLVYAGCSDFSGYTYFNATVTINGEAVENVPVRKKGFLGSISAFRPSLKMNFGRGEAYQERTFYGEKRFTLNNNKQDLSNVRQCLSYELFAKAGVKAPRCNFAHLMAQGNDLGIYSHVEAIKKQFLARVFGDDSGNLYEGQKSDFNQGLKSTFQLKTNEEQNDRSDIDAVIAALQTEDAGLFNALDTVIDMDEFLTFWAMEVLVGHWDSYSGNQNNFYIYHNPADDRFHFIPWGTDGAFNTGHGELSGEMPKSTYAWSEITYRLWNIPETRARYEQRLQELMDNLWDEDALKAEVDRMGQITGTPAAQLDTIKAFIAGRQIVIEEELAGTAPDWPQEPFNVGIVCMEPPATSGSFELTWSDAHSYNVGGTITFDMTVAMKPLVLEANPFSAAGPVPDIDEDMYGVPRIAFSGTEKTDGRSIWIGFYIPDSVWAEGQIRFHGYEIFGIVVESLPSGDYKRLAIIGDGTITLEKAGHTNGATVKGTWQGVVATDPFLPSQEK